MVQFYTGCYDETDSVNEIDNNSRGGVILIPKLGMLC